MKLRSIEACPLPDNALLSEYTRLGAYTDCYRTEISGTVSHASYVTAFYTTRLFKLERLILHWAISKPSSDLQAEQLANGETDSFAAWIVEHRCHNQLLLSDFQGRTRSWLMVEPVKAESRQTTRLYFGSAVTPRLPPGETKPRFGRGFSLLIGFHKLYSLLLLYSAKRRLQHGVSPGRSHNN